MFRLYGDENAQHGLLTRWLREARVDWLTPNEAGTRELTDEQQLEFATRAGRVMLTFDKEDFQRLHAAWARNGLEHAGIVICTEGRISTRVLFAKLMLLQAERSAEDMKNVGLFIGPSPTEAI